MDNKERLEERRIFFERVLVELVKKRLEVVFDFLVFNEWLNFPKKITSSNGIETENFKNGGEFASVFINHPNFLENLRKIIKDFI